jgi:hypothetical protein
LAEDATVAAGSGALSTREYEQRGPCPRHGFTSALPRGVDMYIARELLAYADLPPTAPVRIRRRVKTLPVQFPDDHLVVSNETCPYWR